jgi:hypothetical protein
LADVTRQHLLQSVKFIRNPLTFHFLGDYSTVTDFAKFRGWSTLQPRSTAT